MLYGNNQVSGASASFNYSITTGTVGTTYSWIDCSSGGTEITNSMWSTSGSYDAYDDGYYNVAFPFTFKFYDDTYTTSDNLSICTNGFIRLDGTADDDYSSAQNYNLTSSGTSLGQIVCLGINDCVADNSAGSHVYYKTTGTAPNRIFTIEYQNLEIDYSSGRYADIEVCFYETSNKIVILFGSDNVTATSSDQGIHSGVSGYYDFWQYVHNGTNNSWIEYSRTKKLSSLTVNQASTADVTINSINNKILRLDFEVTGENSGTLNLNSIVVTSQNTSDADIASSGVKLYRTTTTTFSTANQLGSAVSFSSGEATFSSLNYNLPSGTTYIWVSYDISSSGTKSNTVDASIDANDINVGGSTYPSSAQNPAGSRTINYLEWDGSTSRDWTVGSNWSSGSVPTKTDDIVIPSSPSNQPILYDGDNGKCRNIFIQSGATVTLRNASSGGLLKVYGDFTNEGTLDMNSSTKNIQLYGSSKTLGGSGTFTKARLRVNGGSYTLTDDITIYKFVVFNNGTLNLDNNTLTVSNSLLLKDAGDVINMNTGTINLQGSFNDTDGDIQANTGTFYYSGSTSQTIVTKYTYYNLKIKLTSGATRALSSGILTTTNMELTNPGGTSTGTGTLSANLSLKGNLTIGSNCKFDANGHNTSVDGNWINNGTIELGTTTVTFDGSSNQSISGTNTFYNLTVNKSGGNLSLSNDISISNTLTLTSHNISLGSYNLTLGTSATISGGGSSSYIVTNGTGYVKKELSGTGSFTFPVGDNSNYSPFTFNLTAGTVASGAYVTMNVQPSAQAELTSTSYIDRNWELHQSGISGSYSYDATYTYIQADVNGNEADLLPTKLSGGENFQDTSGVNTSTNTVSFTGLTSFSYFGARDLDESGNLPVSWLDFYGEKIGGNNKLFWITASESQNNYFSIERSQNGIDFKEIGIIKGAGNSININRYSFTDSEPVNGLNYYRIKQVDFDGNTDYSKIITIDNFSYSVETAPNPVKDILRITLNNNNGADLVLRDVTGKVLLMKHIETNNSTIDFSTMPAGIYFLNIIFDNKVISRKIVKR